MGAKGTELTGYPAISVFHDFRYHPKQVIGGAFDWIYEHLGMFSWVVEIWSPMREAGIENYQYIEWFRDHPVSDDLKLYRWSKDKLGGVAHVAWKEFEHPQLGHLEIGGWNRFHAIGNPPPQCLERELARFPKWLVWQALTSPKMELVDAQADALGDGHWRIRLVVQNTGWLPSYVSKRALERKVVRGVIAQIAMPEGATLVQGKRREEIGQLEGKSTKHTGVSFWPDYNVTGDNARSMDRASKRGDRVESSRGMSGREPSGRAWFSADPEESGGLPCSFARTPDTRRSRSRCWRHGCTMAPSGRTGSRIERRRHLRGKPQLRQSVRAVSRRRRHANATPGRRRLIQAASARTCRPCGRARIRSGVSKRLAEPAACIVRRRSTAAVRADARSDPQVLSAAGADQRRAQITSRKFRMPAVSRWVTTTARNCRMWKWALDTSPIAFMGRSAIRTSTTWLICATPRTPIPHRRISSLSSMTAAGLKRRADSPSSALTGQLRSFPANSLDGYPLSGMQPAYQLRVPPAPGGDTRFADTSSGVIAPQTKTICDTLSAKGISWAWYGGAWSVALKDGMQPPSAKRMVIYNNEPPAPYFVAHHQPFNYFARFAPGTADRERHLKDYTDLVAGIDRGDLPAVAFYKPQGTFNEHPGNTDVMSGDIHISELIGKIKASPLWTSTAIIVTYDENGGFWDHVAPPKGDRWGPGTRIPAIIISPYAKRGYVDHTSYDTTSIIKFIRALRARTVARRPGERRRSDRRFRFAVRRHGRFFGTLSTTRHAARPHRDSPRLRAFRAVSGRSGSSACAWTSRRSSFILLLPLYLAIGLGHRR